MNLQGSLCRLQDGGLVSDHKFGSTPRSAENSIAIDVRVTLQERVLLELTRLPDRPKRQILKFLKSFEGSPLDLMVRNFRRSAHVRHIGAKLAKEWQQHRQRRR